MTTPERTELLTIGEVAELLRVKESWVRDATRRGAIPSLRFGRLRRYSRADLDAWIERQKQPLQPS